MNGGSKKLGFGQNIFGGGRIGTRVRRCCAAVVVDVEGGGGGGQRWSTWVGGDDCAWNCTL